MRRLAAREQKILAVALLGAVVAVGWLLVGLPISQALANRREEKAQLTETLARDARLIATAPAWRRLASEQLSSAPRFAILASSEPLAVESLKERLQAIGAAEGFAVTSFQDLPAAAAPGQVRVRVDMLLSLTQLYGTLKRLEAEGAYVVVDYLSISADRAFSSGRDALLDVRLELSAAYHPLAARSY